MKLLTGRPVDHPPETPFLERHSEMSYFSLSAVSDTNRIHSRGVGIAAEMSETASKTTAISMAPNHWR